MNNWAKTFAFLALFLIIAVLTNPDEARHKQVLKNKFNSLMLQSMKDELTDSGNSFENAGEALGMMLGGTLVDRMVDALVTSDNYIIFSTTKITWEGKTKVIGFGAFGNVYISPKIEESFNEESLNQNP